MTQPTLSRFENAVNGCALYRMADELATRVIARHRRRLDGRARCITIDLDPTDDPTHGAQQYTLFNGYYDNWCYLPLLGFLTFDARIRAVDGVPRALRLAAPPGWSPPTGTVGTVVVRLRRRLRRAVSSGRSILGRPTWADPPATAVYAGISWRRSRGSSARGRFLRRTRCCRAATAAPSMPHVARARTWRSEQIPSRRLHRDQRAPSGPATCSELIRRTASMVAQGPSRRSASSMTREPRDNPAASS